MTLLGAEAAEAEAETEWKTETPLMMTEKKYVDLETVSVELFNKTPSIESKNDQLFLILKRRKDSN